MASYRSLIPPCVLLAVFGWATAAKIKPASNYFSICHTSDPKYNDCVRKSLTILKPLMKEGIPELKLPSFEPLRISRIQMGDKSAGNFNFHLVLENLVIHGMSNYKIPEVSFDTKKWILNFTLFHSKFDFEGDYSTDGKILLLPLKGEGKATFNFTDVTTKSSVKLEEFKKGGKTFLRIKDYKLSINPKRAQSYFTNLFNGNEQLGESTNKFLNDNWLEAFQTYKELPETAFSQYIKAVANRVYSLYPKDELFPQ